MPSFVRGNLLFEPLTEKHIPLLHTWLNAPHVAERWDGPQSLDEVRSKYLSKISIDWQRSYIVSIDRHQFGYIQCYRAHKAGLGWWPDADDNTVGIDQFIGDPAMLGQGLGAVVVREFSDWLLSQPEIRRVITDPDPTNSRAIHCYRKAGFSDVGLIDTPEGSVLLMEKRA